MIADNPPTPPGDSPPPPDKAKRKPRPPRKRSKTAQAAVKSSPAPSIPDTPDTTPHPYRTNDDWIRDIVEVTGSLNAMLHTARTLHGILFEFVPGNPNGEQLRIVNIQQPKE